MQSDGDPRDVSLERPGCGASPAWTRQDPLLAKARALLAEGRFAEAEQLAASPGGDAQAMSAREEFREIARRIRLGYGLGDDELLARLRKTLPDVTVEDLARWRAAGVLQHRQIDDRTCNFSREPANLLRFCDEACSRRDQAGAPADTRPGDGAGPTALEMHLQTVIRAARERGDAKVCPVRHRVRYTVTAVPARASAGSVLRCWLPFAQPHARQENIRLLETTPAGAVVSPPGSIHRSIFLRHQLGRAGGAIRFGAIFEYTSWAYYPDLSDAAARPLAPSRCAAYLEERPPHIVFSPAVRDAVEKALGDERNPLAQAQKIFAFVHANIRYCAEEEYSTIPAFAEKALRTGRGDCGIQTMLFVTMCRCAGIPARWQSGWQSQPSRLDMHDWAEFYVEPWRWLPADPSYGLRNSADPAVQWFHFGHQDAYRLIVNLDYGGELSPTKRSMRSEPADFQRGELELDGRNLYYDEWSYDMAIDTEAVAG